MYIYKVSHMHIGHKYTIRMCRLKVPTSIIGVCDQIGSHDGQHIPNSLNGQFPRPRRLVTGKAVSCVQSSQVRSA